MVWSSTCPAGVESGIPLASIVSRAGKTEVNSSAQECEPGAHKDESSLVSVSNWRLQSAALKSQIRRNPPRKCGLSLNFAS